MSFKDRRRQAAFRGVPFIVEDRGRSGGRRGPDHEFPFDDVAFPEDLGRAKREFAVAALVIGDDYDQHLDRLLAALEAPGPGVYVDRTAGRVMITALDDAGAVQRVQAAGRAGEVKDDLEILLPYGLAVRAVPARDPDGEGPHLLLLAPAPDLRLAVPGPETFTFVAHMQRSSRSARATSPRACFLMAAGWFRFSTLTLTH